jgi:polar amino acid transport system ATP-binding protein
VFQAFNLFPHLSVLGNVTIGPRKLRGLSSGEAEAVARQLLDKVGLGHKVDAYPQALSGGQKQRVAIARALAMKPQVMLFDEPTSSLDPELTGEVLNVMRSLAADGMTMVVVSHEIGFAASVGQRIVFLDHGRLLLQGGPQEVFRKPRHPRLDQFLDTYLDRGAAMLL